MTTHRKAYAAGAGVLLIALLEYATTTPDVARALELLLPDPWQHLVPILLGGVATVAAVVKAPNTPKSVPADSVEPLAPLEQAPAPMPAPAEASPPDVPSTAGAGATIMDPAPATALVQLRPVPKASWQ